MASSPRLTRNFEPSSGSPDLHLIWPLNPSAILQGLAIIAFRGRKRLLALLALTALGSAVAYLLPAMQNGGQSAPADSTTARAVYPDPSKISLSGSRTGENIEITWNTSAPVLASARIGILSISDGDFKKEIPLTAAELQARKLVYTPITDRVELVLEVFSADGQRTRESVRFVLPAAVIRAPQAVIQSEPVSGAGAASASGEQTRMRRFVPPNTVNSSVPERVVVLEPPPPLLETAQNQAAQNLGSAGLPRLPLPAVPEPQIPAVSLTPRDSARQPTVTPPRAIRETRPTLPPALQAMLSRSTEVEVRILVDETGKVVEAEPLVGTGRLNQYLGSAAAAAAKLWRFEPARRGDRNVSATLVLRFAFLK